MDKTYKYIDADSHILEPEDMWVNYLDPEFRDEMPYSWTGYRCDPLAFDHVIHIGDNIGMPYSRDGSSTAVPGLEDVYGEFIDKNFSSECYSTVMDRAGMDYMVLYPTVGIYITSAPGLRPAQAAAYRRAYNNWLHDFVSGSEDRRLIGAGSVDLRDPEEAVREARRCVKDLGFKAIHVNSVPVDGVHIYDPELEPLWSELEDLDAALGVHVSAGNAADTMVSQVFPGLMAASGISAFSIGNMFASVALIAGGILERHPKLRVVHLECGAGWVPFWLDRMQAGVQGGFRDLRFTGTPLSPDEYFRRQCYISADPDDPGIKWVIDYLGDDNVATATDFGHPEGRGYVHAIQDIFGLEGVSEASKHKLMWDNPARLYGLS